jgi:formylglycine-generating enzyme required for sulfatase activity
MGSDPRRDKEAYSEEQPQHAVTLVAYEIARYRLTVAEYALCGWPKQREPYNWQTQLGKLDHPVSNVN